MGDSISIKNLRVRNSLFKPVEIDISIAARWEGTDEVIALNYSTLGKQLVALIESSSSYNSLFDTIINQFNPIFINLTFPAAFPLGSLSYVFENNTRSIVIKIKTQVVIGINPNERTSFQPLSVLIKTDYKQSYLRIYLKALKILNQTACETLELLAILIINALSLALATVTIEKPNAVVLADFASVQVTRSFDTVKEINGNQVFIAIGTNLDNRVKNIHDAIDLIIAIPTTKLVNTSFLYENAPMYVTEQPNFLNCVVKVTTELDAHELLNELKIIETKLGRPTTHLLNGPRIIDLDIVFYSDIIINHPNTESDSLSLIIPQLKLTERMFVLKPLMDIDPDFIHPVLIKSVDQLYQELLFIESKTKKEEMMRVFVVRDQLWDFKQTRLMGILNVTPDSFSDGMKLLNDDLSLSTFKIIEKVELMVHQGVDIIDIGGCSTRPNSQPSSLESELNYVIPVILLIRKHSDPKIKNIPISVDTFRVQVAKAAIEAGADMINDVTGGYGFVDNDEIGDNEMARLWATTRSSVSIMHMRGSPATMNEKTEYVDVVKEVKVSLKKRTLNAISNGVCKWRILVDPGLGFAKVGSDSFELLTRLEELTDYPVLIGASRKGFIGKAVKSDDANDDKRLFGTVAACCVGISNGASVLRVHDVEAVKMACLVADRC